MDKFIKYNYWTVFLCFLLFLFGFLIISGSLFSGYHFTDDHGILNIARDLSEYNVLEVSQKRIIGDLQIRFRPFYYVHRILETKLFGTNFLGWSIYRGLLGVLTSFFLFLFMRIIGFSVLESILFSCLTLIGEQSAIWWRLGPNETIGMFLLSMSLLFLSFSIFSTKKQVLYEVLFVVFTIFASLSKESFILIIPALLFWKIWLYSKKNGTKWLETIKNNISPIIILLIVCFSEILFIKYFVGTAKIGYAGYEGFNLLAFKKTGLKLSSIGHARIILIEVVLVIIFCFIGHKEDKHLCFSNLKEFTLPITLFGLIVTPQILLYMKSGIYERYLLPGLLGYSYLIVFLYKLIKEILIKETSSNDKGNTKSWLSSIGVIKLKKFILKGTVLALILIAIIFDLRIACRNVNSFVFQGEQTNEWLQSIKQETTESSLILVVTDPAYYYEWSSSIKTYLYLKMNRRNLYVYPILTSAKYNDFQRGFIKSLPKFYGKNTIDNIHDKNSIKAVVLFPGTESKFLTNSANWFNPLLFEKYNNEYGFVSYYRKRLTVTKSS